MHPLFSDTSHQIVLHMRPAPTGLLPSGLLVYIHSTLFRDLFSVSTLFYPGVDIQHHSSNHMAEKDFRGDDVWWSQWRRDRQMKKWTKAFQEPSGSAMTGNMM